MILNIIEITKTKIIIKNEKKSMPGFNIKTIFPEEPTQRRIIFVAIIYHLTLWDLTEFGYLRYLFYVYFS